MSLRRVWFHLISFQFFPLNCVCVQEYMIRLFWKCLACEREKREEEARNIIYRKFSRNRITLNILINAITLIINENEISLNFIIIINTTSLSKKISTTLVVLFPIKSYSIYICVPKLVYTHDITIPKVPCKPKIEEVLKFHDMAQCDLE